MAELQLIEAHYIHSYKIHPVGLLWSKYISLSADSSLRGHIWGKYNKIDFHYFVMSYLNGAHRFAIAPTTF
jgi:hypothetical protein